MVVVGPTAGPGPTAAVLRATKGENALQRSPSGRQCSGFHCQLADDFSFCELFPAFRPRPTNYVY